EPLDALGRVDGELGRQPSSQRAADDVHALEPEAVEDVEVVVDEVVHRLDLGHVVGEPEARMVGRHHLEAPGEEPEEGVPRAGAAHAARAFGRLDAVVNNAGRFGGGPVLELTDDALHEGLDTKVAAGLRVVRHALPHLRASDRAAVVNVSGITAQMVIPGAGVTAMGNAGLLTLTAYLAHELAADGVRVNGIVPGYTLTGVWRDRARALADAEGMDVEQAEHAILERRGIA